MSKFEDNLWRKVTREHGERLAETPAPTGGGRRGGRRLVAGTSVALAGAGTALALLLSAASSPPAFAVSRDSNGTVHVVIWRVKAIASANARLAQLGIPVVAVPVTAACAPVPMAGRPAPLLHAARAIVPTPAMRRAVVDAHIDARRIPHGQKLVLAAQAVGRARLIAAGTMRGAVPACMAVAPAVARVQVMRLANGRVCALPSVTIAPAPSPPMTVKPGTGTGTTTTWTGTTTTGTGTTTTGTGTTTTGTGTTTTGTGTTTTGTGTTTTSVQTPVPGGRRSAHAVAPRPACRAILKARVHALALAGAAAGNTTTKPTSTTATSTTSTSANAAPAAAPTPAARARGGSHRSSARRPKAHRDH